MLDGDGGIHEDRSLKFTRSALPALLITALAIDHSRQSHGRYEVLGGGRGPG